MDVLQVAQRATDLERSVAFYTTLLGAAPVARYDPPGLVFFRIGDVRLLLERDATPATLYLRVDALDATLDRLRAAGIAIDTEPHVIFQHGDETLGPAGTHERHAFVRDPDGNLVGLVDLVPAN